MKKQNLKIEHKYLFYCFKNKKNKNRQGRKHSRIQILMQLKGFENQTDTRTQFSKLFNFDKNGILEFLLSYRFSVFLHLEQQKSFLRTQDRYFHVSQNNSHVHVWCVRYSLFIRYESYKFRSHKKSGITDITPSPLITSKPKGPPSTPVQPRVTRPPRAASYTRLTKKPAFHCERRMTKRGTLNGYKAPWRKRASLALYSAVSSPGIANGISGLYDVHSRGQGTDESAFVSRFIISCFNGAAASDNSTPRVNAKGRSGVSFMLVEGFFMLLLYFPVSFPSSLSRLIGPLFQEDAVAHNCE